MDLGPDNNLYLVIGDLNREANPEYMNVAQNIEDSQMPDGRGGVLRMTVEGNPVQESNGFSLENSDISNFYY
ncbi:MAG TPA: hypothetical protein VFK40_02830, partial [Nitrososphaeraceae archaeon]|nr:hypothetical protein [Nitrososphaeraceae archaeon]